MNKEQVLKIVSEVLDFDETSCIQISYKDAPDMAMHKETFLSQLSLDLDKEEEKDWVPKEADEYWFVGDDGDVLPSSWDGVDVDNARLAFKNVFRTREQAEARLEAIKNLSNADNLLK